MSYTELFCRVFQDPGNARLLAWALHPDIVYSSPDEQYLVALPFDDNPVVMLKDGKCFMAVTEANKANIAQTIPQLRTALNDVWYLTRRHSASCELPYAKMEAYVILDADVSQVLPSSIATDAGDVPLNLIPLESGEGVLALYREAVQDANEKFAPDGPARNLWCDPEGARERYILDYIEVRSTKYLIDMVLGMDTPEEAPNTENPQNNGTD